MAENGVTTADELDGNCRKFLAMATAATGVVGATYVAAPFISSWAPSERALALGVPVEFDLSTLEPDWPGGFACPCHGSRFDLAGRVFEDSPASVNLRVPPYAFADARKLLIGIDDERGAA